jgi:hypothetical protein
MNEEVVRAMIRESIARRVGSAHPAAPQAPSPMLFTGHSSHNRYRLPESGGPCLIEPNVACNHCGYCESHGY